MKERIMPLPQLRKRRSKKRMVRHKDLNQDVIDIITRISNEHCNNVFGYLDEDDLKGEIWTICLEVLDDFDPEEGKLEHFLRVSVKNRLVNRFKELTRSVRSPCNRCPYFDKGNKDNDCARFSDAGTQENPLPERSGCDKWKNYQLSIQSRNGLLNATEPIIEPKTEHDPLSKLVGSELMEVILTNISDESKQDLLDILEDRSIPKQRLEKVRVEVLSILESRYGSDYLW